MTALRTLKCQKISLARQVSNGDGHFQTISEIERLSALGAKRTFSFSQLRFPAPSRNFPDWALKFPVIWPRESIVNAAEKLASTGANNVDCREKCVISLQIRKYQGNHYRDWFAQNSIEHHFLFLHCFNDLTHIA